MNPRIINVIYVRAHSKNQLIYRGITGQLTRERNCWNAIFVERNEKTGQITTNTKEFTLKGLIKCANYATNKRRPTK